ncbi:MAG: hypothetical protein Q8S22_00295, partial [Eubacteriales bacterium]|nr:hypothetical protein [Eubacteriales bacterium]
MIGTITQTISTISNTITHIGGITLVQRIYVLNEEQSEWRLDSVMIQLPNLTKVYSDGTVEPASEDTLTMHFVKARGVIYQMQYIEATLGDISLTMHDPAGSLLDGNGNALNLKAGGDIDFFLRTTGSVGTPDKLLDISAGGKVTVYDITGEKGLISSSIYLFVPAAEGSITLEQNTRIINGATYHVETENGDILGNRVEVIAGNLILDAHSNGSDPLITGAIRIVTLIVRYDPALDAADEGSKVHASTADLDAMGDIEIPTFTAGDESTVAFTSTGGGLTSDTWNVDDSQVTASVFGDYAIGAFTAGNGSVVTLTSSHGGLTSDTWDSTNSEVTASVFGDIAVGAFTASAGSTVQLTSSNGGLTSETWNIANSDVTASVFGDIAITAFTADNGTIIMTSSNGGLASDTWDLDNGSDVTASVYGDITINTLIAEDSDVSLTSSNGGLTSESWGAGDSSISAFVHDAIEITLAELVDSLTILDSTHGGLTSESWTIDGGEIFVNVYGDISIDTAEATDAIVTLYSKAGRLNMDALQVGNGSWSATVYGDIEIPQIDTTESGLVLQSTEGSIFFDTVTASRSHVSLLAYDQLALLDGSLDHPLIRFAKDDTPDIASLTLSAAHGGIGSSLHRLQIDIPAEITVRINEVTYYYLEAVDLPLASYPFYAILSGFNSTDEDALYLTGVYLKYSDEQFFEVLLNASTPQELAAWIAHRAPERTYLESIDATALWAAVHSASTGKPDATALNALFGKTLGKKLYSAMIGTSPAILTESDLLGALKTALTEQTTSLVGGVSATEFVIDSTSANAVLAALLNKDLIDSLGDLLSELLTQDDIQNFFRRALEASVTPTDTCIDPPARDFHLSVGLSTGKAFVTNEGSIAITQDEGDVTIGIILSVRGDVAIEALTGNILASTSDNLVTGWNITLNAQGDVGTSAQPININ